MVFSKVNGGYVLRFDRDEKLIAGLSQFAVDQGIRAAWLTGLGAASGAELGFYNLDRREYEWRTITELMEITNLTGNIVGGDNGEVAIHAHTTLSDSNFQAIGGHVKELIVGGTCEVWLHNMGQQEIKRKFNDSVGLATLDL